MTREQWNNVSFELAQCLHVLLSCEEVWDQLEKTEDFGVKFCWLHSLQVVFLTSIRRLKTFWRATRRDLVHRDRTARNISPSLLYSHLLAYKRQLQTAVSLLQLTLLGKTFRAALPLYSETEDYMVRVAFLRLGIDAEWPLPDELHLLAELHWTPTQFWAWV